MKRSVNVQYKQDHHSKKNLSLDPAADLCRPLYWSHLNCQWVFIILLVVWISEWSSCWSNSCCSQETSTPFTANQLAALTQPWWWRTSVIVLNIIISAVFEFQHRWWWWCLNLKPFISVLVSFFFPVLSVRVTASPSVLQPVTFIIFFCQSNAPAEPLGQILTGVWAESSVLSITVWFFVVPNEIRSFNHSTPMLKRRVHTSQSAVCMISS